MSHFSKNSICNLAMSWLGANEILDITDDKSVEAEHCRTNYDISREMVLEKGPWTFATTRRVLQVAANEEPAFGPDAVFIKPTGSVRIWRIFKNADIGVNDSDYSNWNVEGDRILIYHARTEGAGGPFLGAGGGTIAFAQVIENVTDTSKFSANFAHALAARIAADTCIAITGNRNLKADMEAAFENKLSDAMSLDGTQARTEKTRATRLTRVRRI